MSYVSNQSGVQQVQLKVQEIHCKLSDTQVCSSSSWDLTIDVGQIVGEVRLFTFFDDSATTNLPRQAASITFPTTSTVKIALGATPAAADSFHMYYTVTPPAQS